MKNLWGVLFIGLITLTQAQAALICKSDSGNTQLSITEKILFPNTRNATEGAIVVLTDGPVIKNFSGTVIKDFANLELTSSKSFKLISDQDESALLKISTVTTYTPSRCGRCSPLETEHIYAKLILNQEEMDFSCHSQASN